jgi:hypothetical protein
VKIAVLASPKDAPILVEILGALAEADAEAYGLKIHDTWQDLPRSDIFNRLQKADRYLIVLDPGLRSDSWIHFAVGFALGRNLGIALYRADSSMPLPRYLEGLPVLSGREEIVAHYRAEKAEWFAEDLRHSARAALLEMGISCHADSLAQCVRDGDTRAVDLFLKADFPPDSRDKHGVTLLGQAARCKHLAVAQLLLAHGADLHQLSEDRSYSPLMDAALSGSIELVKLFLAKGADPDIRSKDGQTALIVAVGRNDAATARLLLDYGADPDIEDKLGLSARKYAVLFKMPALAALFDGSRPASGSPEDEGAGQGAAEDGR